jgi:hypothetical protein
MRKNSRALAVLVALHISTAALWEAIRDSVDASVAW